MSETHPEPSVHQVFVHDSAGAYESLVVDGYGDDGTEAIRVHRGGTDGRSASAGATPDGRISDYIGGRASGKEQRELRTAQTLVLALNQSGASWGDPEVLSVGAHGERGVDCVAHDNAGLVLQIQVTTIERHAWRTLDRQSSYARSESYEVVVEAIRLAIAAKATRADPRVILALDATDSVRAALRSVVARFRSEHGSWAASIGFEQIWLIGPVVDLTQRLDIHV